ncbi:MAG: hypothetical protein AVDCRST_MAG41-4531, partial [uncultured Corynebacteriales bacterium]
RSGRPGRAGRAGRAGRRAPPAPRHQQQRQQQCQQQQQQQQQPERRRQPVDPGRCAAVRRRLVAGQGPPGRRPGDALARHPVRVGRRQRLRPHPRDRRPGRRPERRQPVRLRLLRPHPVGLGPGRGPPAALLRLPVHRRPADRPIRPHAGRPGVLGVRPGRPRDDPPRRHLSRWWTGRSGTAERGRREDLGHVVRRLHRCGPSGRI